jgi:hypothetical protein
VCCPTTPGGRQVFAFRDDIEARPAWPKNNEPDAIGLHNSIVEPDLYRPDVAVLANVGFVVVGNDCTASAGRSAPGNSRNVQRIGAAVEHANI